MGQEASLCSGHRVTVSYSHRRCCLSTPLRRRSARMGQTLDPKAAAGHPIPASEVKKSPGLQPCPARRPPAPRVPPVPPPPALPPPAAAPGEEARSCAYRGSGEPGGEAGGVRAAAAPQPPPRGCCSFFFGRQWGNAERLLGAAAEGQRRGGAPAPSGSESSDSLKPKKRWKRPRRAMPGSVPPRWAAGLCAAAVPSRRQPGQERQRGEGGAGGGSCSQRGAACGFGLSAGMEGAAVAAAGLSVCV